MMKVTLGISVSCWRWALGDGPWARPQNSSWLCLTPIAYRLQPIYVLPRQRGLHAAVHHDFRQVACRIVQHVGPEEDRLAIFRLDDVLETGERLFNALLFAAGQFLS